jgi:hypothetical protein
MDCAKILPLRCAHLGTGDRRARRTVGEQGDDDGVDFLCEESAELIQPQSLVNILGRLCQLERHFLVYCDCSIGADRMREEVVQRFEVFSKLES